MAKSKSTKASAATRPTLPERRNTRLTDEQPTYEQLLRTRKNGETNLGTSKKGFTYVHLKAPLPVPLEDSEIFPPPNLGYYFLMRRAADGFVSATGMFKCAFPWATHEQEKAERAHVRTFEKTSGEETAGNVWVHPDDALKLADEYGMRVWIEALIDPEPVVNDRSRLTTPARSTPTAEEKIASPVAEKARRRSTRSVSPSKRTPRKRASKAAAIKESSLKNETTITETEETITEETTLKAEESTTTVIADDALYKKKKKPIFEMPPPAAEDGAVKVEVDSTVETNGEVAVKSTKVTVDFPKEIEMPETTEQMIAKAKEMVEAAKKLEGPSSSKKSRKRGAEEISTMEPGEQGEGEEESVEEEQNEQQPAKKTKVLETELKKEKVKTRALIGLSATLALGALLPYVL